MGSKDDFKLFVGQRINNAMGMKGYTQAQLSHNINCTPIMISNYVTGKNLPPADILAKLAVELEVTTDWLLGVSSSDMSYHDMRIIPAMSQQQAIGQSSAIRSSITLGDFFEILLSYDNLKISKSSPNDHAINVQNFTDDCCSIIIDCSDGVLYETLRDWIEIKESISHMSDKVASEILSSWSKTKIEMLRKYPLNQVHQASVDNESAEVI